MKLNVINIMEASGVSKKTGKSFSMLQLTFLGSFENITTDNYCRIGTGFTPIELNISDSFFNDLKTNFLSKFKGQPLEMDFETIVNGRGHTVISGFVNS